MYTHSNMANRTVLPYCHITIGGGVVHGASLFPRVLDGPILLSVLALTLSISPISFLMGFLVPFAVVIDWFFGPVLRGPFATTSRQSPSGSASFGGIRCSSMLSALVSSHP